MSYFYLQSKITSTPISKREYYSSSKTLFNITNFYKTQKYVLLTRQYTITNVKYTKQTAYFVNFIKHKKRIYSYTNYTHSGVLLHLKQKQPYLSLYWQKNIQ